MATSYIEKHPWRVPVSVLDLMADIAWRIVQTWSDC